MGWLWHVGQEFEKDGKPARVTKITDRADHGLLIKNRKTGKAGVAVDWESLERLPDGSPRRLGRMIW